MAQVLIQKFWKGVWLVISYSILEGSEQDIFYSSEYISPIQIHIMHQLSLLPSALSLLKILLEDTQEGCVHFVFFSYGDDSRIIFIIDLVLKL